MSSPADGPLAPGLAAASSAAQVAGGPAASTARRGRSWAVTRRRGLLALLLPALVVLFVVTILPFIFLVATSFTPLDLTKPGSFRLEGAGNYRELLRDDRFWNSVWVQARLSFWTVLLQLLIGLGLARLLHTGSAAWKRYAPPSSSPWCCPRSWWRSPGRSSSRRT